MQEANALAGADQVDLGVGVHELSIDGADEDEAATGDLDLTDDLTIAGANAYLSIIDANGVDRVLDQLAAADTPLELTLRDLTITGGDTTSSGGGLRYSSGVDAERIIVTGNSAQFGDGGLAASDTPFDEPALDLRVSIVSLNSALDGGGIDAGFSPALSVELSILIANTALGEGGAVSFSGPDGDAPFQFDLVTVYGNSAAGSGLPRGGGSAAAAAWSWIRAGSATISWASGALPRPTPVALAAACSPAECESTITNTTIEGNLAADGGGLGINGEVAISHATIARNGAEARGGALYRFGGGSQTSLQNTIIAENSPANCTGLLPTSLGHNLGGDPSCTLAAGGDSEDVDPQLGALGNYGGPTRAIPPLPDSVAIEGGTDAGFDVDQRGIARPQLAQFDIGAVELQGRRARQQYTGGFTSNPHSCDLDRNARVDFADLDRLIASFPVTGGHFHGNASNVCGRASRAAPTPVARPWR